MFKPLRSITRLILGGMVIGYDELQNRMKLWEQQASEIEDLAETEPTISEHSMRLTHSQEIAPTFSEKEMPDSLGYLLIGLSVKLQERFEDRMRTVNGISHFIGSMTKPILKPFYSNRAFTPMRNSFNNLVFRGQQEIDQWIEAGRRETIHSRALVKTAIHEGMDSSIEYLANDPQVEELVTSQSAGLIDEMVEEVRERTVSADDFLESIIRSTLRLPLRSELPPPPPELKKHAIPYRVRKGRMIYK
jgi:hypothetical protein